MASATRSSIASAARTIASNSTSNLISRTLTPKSVHVHPIVAALGTVESMVPLHSAIASARLISSIGVESTCWSWLSQVIRVAYKLCEYNCLLFAMSTSHCSDIHVKN
ncbi:uncharacterized protein LOC143593413 [Bidens hawaiensis]|uniref:uncharacterized protein LOC143593413 n=1 Tax=Bidens hawaiensis TaxID=980011 RepID=UPI00404B16C9